MNIINKLSLSVYKILSGLLLYVLVVGGTTLFGAHAQDVFSDIPKKVTVIMPYGPGGAADLQYRHFQEYMGKKGIDVIGIYKPGGDGSIAMRDLAGRERDGSVISFTAAGIVSHATTLFGFPSADPLTIAGVTLNAFVVNPTGPFNTLEKYEAALLSGDPRMDIGWHAVGTLMTLNRYLDKLGVKTEPLKVPFKTPVQSSTAVAGGHLQSAVVPMSVAEQMVAGGKLTLIAVVGPSSVVPPGNTVSLSKRWKDWQHSDGFMIAAPTGWKPQTTKMWLKALQTYYADPSTKAFFVKNHYGQDKFGPEAAQELIDNATRELAKTREIK